ncbi:MAG: M23 family metallopeptidase [Holosporales bacterium]|jgi:murein DD-endopeptidase MepM/ murein hydrolase activator NlpD|nr:M23 family metallopeptidase [Holosporales bacterium]
MCRVLVLLLISIALSGCTRRSAPAPVEYGIENDGFVDYASHVKRHRVVAGDTIASISDRYMVSVGQLIDYNKLETQRLKIGQLLMIPPNARPTAIPEKVEVVSSVPIIKGYEERSYTNRGNIVDDKHAEQIVRSKPTKPDKTEKVSAKDLESKLDAQLASIKGKKSLSTPEKKVTAVAEKPETLNLSMPLKGKILSKYHASLGDGYNDGINIEAKLGAPVKSAAPGVVLFASGQLKAYGNLILIKHNDSIMTVYGHLSKMAVKKGAKIHKNMVIGWVGKSGNVTSPQLHFEVRQNKIPIDPYKFVKR